MSNVYGYLKLYSNEQDVQSQIDQLKAAGAHEIFQEKPSLKQTGTPQLDKLLSLVRQGDTLLVTSLDRIALNTKHLLEVVESLSAAGVAFKILDNSIVTSSSEGDVICRVLGAIVDFEGRVVRQRQSFGIAKAKKEGRYKGRKPTAAQQKRSRDQD